MTEKPIKIVPPEEEPLVVKPLKGVAPKEFVLPEAIEWLKLIEKMWEEAIGKQMAENWPIRGSVSNFAEEVDLGEEMKVVKVSKKKQKVHPEFGG